MMDRTELFRELAEADSDVGVRKRAAKAMQA